MADAWPASWTRARLGDVADVRWGDTSTTKAAYVPRGYIAYSASGPDGFLPHADFDRTGVVLSAIGADCGKTWLARGSWSCIKNTIRFWATDSDVDSSFLYWLTRDPRIWPRRGSAQPFISQGDARALEIAYPDLAEQRAIADVLGTLDDKIELNRRANETLEAIARALFKSWFVDFDPVRAKSEGRDPGLPPHLADLFPDSLEDSELGEIPTGWRVSGLDEIATYLNGLALQKYPPDDSSSLPVIKIAQLRAGHTDGADRASAGIPGTYVVENGDILFSWSGSLEVEVWCGGRGALNQHLFKVTSNRFPKWLYYLWIRRHLPEFRSIAAGKATTMGHIQRGHLSAARVLVPPDLLMESMTKVFAPLVSATVAARTQSRTLADFRDALIPKLVAGELSVSDIERLDGRT